MERDANLMAGAPCAGGRLVCCGAGSSGLMALADSLKLPGTFGIDAELAGVKLTRVELSLKDCLICVSASGSIAYAMWAQKLARALGVPAIALACNLDSPLFQVADVPVLIQIHAEVVAGSTQRGAGTAQTAQIGCDQFDVDAEWHLFRGMFMMVTGSIYRPIAKTCIVAHWV